MIGLRCEICGHREKANLKNHLEAEHNLTTKQYRSKYPNSKTMTGHSKRTVEYWIYKKGYSHAEAKEAVKNFQSLGKKNYIKSKIKTGLTQEQAQKLWNKKQAKCSPRSMQYYLDKGMTEEQARQEQSKLQSKFSTNSPRFSGHNHTEETKKQISSANRKIAYQVGPSIMAKRFRNKSENGVRSNIEIKCYNELKQVFPKLKANMEVGNYIVDMLLDKIVIEFYGDFWHRNPKYYLAEDLHYGKTSEAIWKYDKRRAQSINKEGYTTVVVWETDWKNNKEQVIEEIRKIYESKQDSKTK